MKYWEDFVIGERRIGRDDYLVTREEIIEFGRRWDPAPFHADEEAAKASVFGGLIAPGPYLLAIQTWLMHRYEQREGEVTAAIARVATDDLRFHQAVRPGDRISFEMECVDKRESDTRPDRGIIADSIILRNQRGEPVLTLKNTILVEKRNPGNSS
ncbi:MAG: MaoC/PaaZ C-terminal domain-containing protein [Dehalococcoidia bacterium]